MIDDDRRDANRILSAALDDPKTVSKTELDRAVGLLDSDAERVRLGAAWGFGLVAETAPEKAVPYVSQIAAAVDASDPHAAAARALAYVAQSNPEAVERELRTLEESAARRCRKAMWGQFADRTVVEVPDGRDGPDGASTGRSDGDRWGWVGGGSTTAYDTDDGGDRRGPPTDRPVDPPAVDHEYDRYTPIETIHRGPTARTFKVVYHTPGGDIHPGLFKTFDPPGESFRPAFDRRIGMWDSVDGHDAILPVLGWGTTPDPWVVTACEPTTGVAALGEERRLAAAVWTLRTVADALRFAHERGVIHGALVPGAVVRSSILTEPGAWRYPRVTDWGYVGLLRAGRPPESIPGRYLAPEHVEPETYGAVDGATDVYGFGTVALEALAGDRGDVGDGRAPRNGEVALPADLERRLPDLGGFLRRCLATRKAERFGTAAAMAGAFDAATEDLDG
ncbi:protein kinase domain protein [Natronomonas moolapensis 8.8.11]|uniref:Protein kinase domain protein n=1 Tax=Natronomonas moolapensis (strain DSM 18674 / CECT 7526 / JCM 14361 / 8.8.11) TaxID=268739 RepID=M1XN77_NATM8|nr:protein kinase [Natronomonas moolapensis]CCQ35339.1 protein kinase domain protein [Natronomonas moolapensis 8.8.11]